MHEPRSSSGRPAITDLLLPLRGGRLVKNTHPGMKTQATCCCRIAAKKFSSRGAFDDFGDFSPAIICDHRALALDAIRMHDLRRELTARDRTGKLQITVESLHSTVRQFRNLFPEPGF
jgi:hypothetical protein